MTVGSASGQGTSPSASATGTGLAVGYVAGHSISQPIALSAGFVAEPQVTTPNPVASLVDGYELSAPTPTLTGTVAKAMYWSATVAVFVPAA